MKQLFTYRIIIVLQKTCPHNFRIHIRHNQFRVDWLMRQVFCSNPSCSLRVARVVHGLYLALDLSLDLSKGMLDRNISVSNASAEFELLTSSTTQRKQNIPVESATRLPYL
jgi:hypothetical protein